MSCHDPAPSSLGRLTRPTFFDADLATPVIAARTTRLPGAVTAVDARRGASRFVWTHEAPPASLAVTAQHRRRGATTPSGVAALEHLARHAERWNLDGDALATVEVLHVHDLGHGAIVVKLGQRVGGVPVARTSLSVVMDRNLQLIALSGGLHAAARPTPDLLAPVLRVGPADAIAKALDDAGAGHPVLLPLADNAGYRRFTVPGHATPARVREVMYPIGMQLVPAWETELGLRDADKRIVGYRHVFAADDGRLLLRAGLSNDAGFSYRVFADATGDFRPADGPMADYSPHPTGNPDGFFPAFQAPNLITTDGFNHNPANGHDPWLAPGATITSGNNVDAYADLDFTDGFSSGDVQPTTTAAGVFDRTYNVALPPDASAAQQMAAITNLFYITNWLHDYWYDSGFNESAGNAQASNFGRGGVGGDPLLAEGQDSSGTDNANMFTPADGESPRMQMYTWTAPTGGVNPDGTIDNPIIEHEWGHYLHLRLVNCGSTQCGGMSEGWADFDALLTTARAADNLDGVYGLGAYALQSYSHNAAYFGIRRYPYSTNLGKSPLTFRFIEEGVPMPSGPIYSDVDFLQGAPNYEVHDIGEIWCAMLWEGFVDVLKLSKGASPKYTFEQARRVYADYLVAGMIATPVEPNFTEQRDAILAAIAASDPQDFVLVAHSYAKRGFGTRALSPALASPDGSGVVEDFSVAGLLDVTSVSVTEDDATACDHDGIVDVGEIGTVTVTVRNAGAGTLAGPTVQLTSSTPNVSFPSGTTATLPAIAPFGTATASVKVRLDEGAIQPTGMDFTVAVADASAAIPSIAVPASAAVDLDINAAASASDDFEAPTLAWTASSGWQRANDDAGNHFASVKVAVGGDHTLQTPGLMVMAGQHLMISFQHRFNFQHIGAALSDGGVLEISTNGTTFQDVSAFANPSYSGTIGGTGNPLAGRAGYGGTSASFPGFDPVALDLGTSFGGQQVFFRFRAGGDNVAGTSAWDVDQVAVTGISNTPFPMLVPETGDCLVGSRPIAVTTDLMVMSGHTGMLDGSASHDPDGGSLTFEWSQQFGAALDLSSTQVAQPTFTAPVVTADHVAGFQLVVRDPDNRVSIPATMRVTILAPGTGVDASVPDAPAADAPADSPAGPDAGNPETGNGGGCCDTGGDGRGGLVLAAAVALVLVRRRRRGCRRPV